VKGKNFKIFIIFAVTAFFVLSLADTASAQSRRAKQQQTEAEQRQQHELQQRQEQIWIDQQETMMKNRMDTQNRSEIKPTASQSSQSQTISTSARPAASSDNMLTLDNAIAQAAANINGRFAAGSKIAILNFNSPTEKFSAYVLDELTANLVSSRKLIVVDRKETDLIRGELIFQTSGEVADESIQELGRMLGAQVIASGSLTGMDDFYRIVIRVLNVQNASVEVHYRADIVNDRIVTALLAEGRTSGTAASNNVQTTQTSTQRTTASSVQETRAVSSPPGSAPASKTANTNEYSPAQLQNFITRYERLLEQCSVRKSDRCADVMYNLGGLYCDQGSYVKARDIWERIIREYPNFKRTNEVKVRLINLPKQ